MKKPAKKVKAAPKAAHAKPAVKKAPAKVKAARHAAAVKAARVRAANLKKAKAHPRVALALGGGVACCAAEALAASLRLAGWPVTDEDVLALYWRTASDEDAGASILATLEAAGEYGLAGVRPVSFGPALNLLDALTCDNGNAFTHHRRSELEPANLLLGCVLPARHAVLDTGSEWITWGESWPAWAFPDAAIDEAWEVTWPGTR